MKQHSWTNTTTDPPVIPMAPKPLPYKPCTDPERHRILRAYQLEYQGRVCLWCDPEHANSWGRIVDDWLCRDVEYNQYALVQELRREEKIRFARRAAAYQHDRIYPDRITGARELQGMTYQHLEQKTEIRESDLILFESGMLVPSTDQLFRIAGATGFPMAWFSKPPDPAWPGIEYTTLRFHTKERKRR